MSVIVIHGWNVSCSIQCSQNLFGHFKKNIVKLENETQIIEKQYQVSAWICPRWVYFKYNSRHVLDKILNHYDFWQAKNNLDTWLFCTFWCVILVGFHVRRGISELILWILGVLSLFGELVVGAHLQPLFWISKWPPFPQYTSPISSLVRMINIDALDFSECSSEDVISFILPLSVCITDTMCIVNGAVVAQWIRPQTLGLEVPGSILLAAAVVFLGKALYTLLPSPSERTLSHNCPTLAKGSKWPKWHFL